jgi:hypothetical protein
LSVVFEGFECGNVLKHLILNLIWIIGKVALLYSFYYKVLIISDTFIMRIWQLVLSFILSLKYLELNKKEWFWYGLKMASGWFLSMKYIEKDFYHREEWQKDASKVLRYRWKCWSYKVCKGIKAIELSFKWSNGMNFKWPQVEMEEKRDLFRR